jgi:hypothetical protein
MKLLPHIHSIYIAPFAGKAMLQMPCAEIIAGQGIKGDRYATSQGAFSGSTPTKIRHISLIATSGIDDANQALRNLISKPFLEAETRRNIVMQNISAQDLNDLVGVVFYLGGLKFKGIELCAPCERPAKLLGRIHFLDAFENRGGLRAEAFESGVLSCGNTLSVVRPKSL